MANAPAELIVSRHAAREPATRITVYLTVAVAVRTQPWGWRKFMRRNTTPPHLNKAELMARGWTKALIRDFLGEPDEHCTNPYYRSGPPICWYWLVRVEQVERQPEFQQARTRAERRRKLALDAAECRRRELLSRVEGLTIEVPRLEALELERHAWESYSRLQWERDHAEADGAGADLEFMQRICVNYLRHELTIYDQQLREIAGQVGCHSAYLALKSKVLKAIADVYPDLAPECMRQEDRMRRDMVYP